MGTSLFLRDHSLHTSLCIQIPELSYALGVPERSFHIGLIAFGILYSPISELTGFIMNYCSRVFEYQADDYAWESFGAEPLISALKKTVGREPE